MNYKESQEILEEVKKAQRVLVNCHINPDPDSVGGALSMYQVLKKMGKSVRVVCPSIVLKKLDFLPHFENIETIDFSKLKYVDYDLIVSLDSSSWDRVSGSKEIPLPKIPICAIDHHTSNTYFGKVNLVDESVTSMGELLTLVFNDWKTSLNKDIATCLLTGIVGDTGAFRYPGVTAGTFEVVKQLMDLGADKDNIILKIYRSYNFNILTFWAKVLSEMKIDKENKFIWTAIPYESFLDLGKPAEGKETAASFFSEEVEETDFGIVMVEQEKGKLGVSLRSRTGFDTSRIAVALGGGGHVYSSGAKIEGLTFKKAVEKVLRVARKYAETNKQS